jgi:hypothetical protein
MTHLVARNEPWLVLLAAPPLVLRERFPIEWQLAALAWIGLLWWVRRAQTGRWTVPTALDGPIVALMLTLPVAVVAAVNLDAALAVGPAGATLGGLAPAAAVSRVESLVFAVAVYYALANGMTTPRRTWSAVSWLLVAGLGLVAVGLVSVGWVSKLEALAPALSRLPRWLTAVPHPTLPALQSGQVGVHPNTLGALLLPFLCLALFALAASATGPAPSAAPRWLRPLAVLSLLVGLPAVVLAQSRAAWLVALVLAAALAIAWRRRPLPSAAPWALAVAIGVLAVLPAVLVGPARPWLAGAAAAPVTAGAMGGPGAGGRLQLWGESLELLSQRPGSGIGLNAFPLIHGLRPEYGGGYIYQGYPHAHNVLVQAALDYSLAGYVAVIGLYAAVLFATVRAHRRLAGTPLDRVTIGLAAALAAYGLYGLFDAVAIGSKPGFIVWALAGTLAGIRYHARLWALPSPDAPAAGAVAAAADDALPEGTAPALRVAARRPGQARRHAAGRRGGAAGLVAVLATWLAASAAAVLALGAGTPAALGVGAAGGILVGWLSSQRVSGQRVRLRRPSGQREVGAP